MPKWGLTESQRRASPWGLPAALLVPAKVITDPVHEDIYVTELERRLIDSPPLQRLRRVRQLGTSHLVYPAAGHSRFSHSIGALRVAQDLLDAVADNRSGPRHTPDLLDEWAEQGTLENGTQVIDACFAEATVLARLGALLHDLCHVPLGHTIEDDLKVLSRHDDNGRRFDFLWMQLDEDARRAIDQGKSIVYPGGPHLKEELRRLILSGEKPTGLASSYPFVADIVGNTICADLIDYLKRDHLFTGLPIALGDRFLDDFYVIGSQHPHFAKKMVVRIARRGRPRSDVVTELVKFLRYRYELTERVLNHHTKIAADAMVGKLLEIWSDLTWLEIAATQYPVETAQIGRNDIDRLRHEIHRVHPELLPDAEPDLTSTDDPVLRRSRVLRDMDQLVEARLEAEFLKRSDDGLLEHLSAVSNPSDGRIKAVNALAQAVLDRRLFKLIGHAESPADMALAQEKYKKFGLPNTRRELERDAAALAELAHGYDVVIWLPNPDMRLKVAGVLVDDGEGIAPLDRVSKAGGEIVEAHRNLWSVSIYAALDLENPEHIKLANVLLGRLKERMDLRVVRWDGEAVKTVDELAVDRIEEVARLSREESRKLLTLAPAAMGARPIFRDRISALWEAARENGLVNDSAPDRLW